MNIYIFDVHMISLIWAKIKHFRGDFDGNLDSISIVLFSRDLYGRANSRRRHIVHQTLHLKSGLLFDIESHFNAKRFHKTKSNASATVKVAAKLSDAETGP